LGGNRQRSDRLLWQTRLTENFRVFQAQAKSKARIPPTPRYDVLAYGEEECKLVFAKLIDSFVHFEEDVMVFEWVQGDDNSLSSRLRRTSWKTRPALV
jgi:hypothetical protein